RPGRIATAHAAVHAGHLPVSPRPPPAQSRQTRAPRSQTRGPHREKTPAQTAPLFVGARLAGEGFWPQTSIRPSRAGALPHTRALALAWLTRLRPWPCAHADSSVPRVRTLR